MKNQSSLLKAHKILQKRLEFNSGQD